MVLMTRRWRTPRAPEARRRPPSFQAGLGGRSQKAAEVWFRSVASGHYALSRGLLRGLVRTAADGEHPAPGGADAGCWERTCAWATLARDAAVDVWMLQRR
jgi:hypothetical protein